MNKADINSSSGDLTESDLQLINKLERRELHSCAHYLFSAIVFLIGVIAIAAGPLIGSETLFLEGMWLTLAAGSLFGMVRSGSRHLNLIRKLLSQSDKKGV